MQIIVDDILTNYYRAGKGKPLLILHGWGDAAAGWRATARKLAENYEVIVPDLPGFGASGNPPQAWGLTDYAEFTARFLKKLKIEPYAILGHSNGGAVALRGLSQGQLTADKLVLLASAGVRGEAKGRNKALRLLAKTGKFAAVPLPAGVKQKLRRRAYRTIGSDALVAEHLHDTFVKIVEDDVRGDAPRVAVPALLIYGRNDEATPVRYGEMLQAAMPQARLEIVPDAAHFVHLDNPARVLELVREFLR